MDAAHLRVAAATGALVAAVAHAGPAPCAHSPALRRALGVRDGLDDRARVALSFDDGPDARGTPAVLELLASLGATATFFLVGEQVRRCPAVAAEVVAAGHEIALHGYRHRNLLRVGARALRDDYARATAEIAAATARVPRLYRPPYGVLTGAALAQARRAGAETVLWTRWGRDWRAAATPAGVLVEATRGLAGGEIILLHDADRYGAPGSWRTTTAALPGIVDAVRAAGLGLAPVR